MVTAAHFPERQIAFATYGEGGRGMGRHPFSAYVSIDMSDEAAAAVLKRTFGPADGEGAFGRSAAWEVLLDGLEDRAFITPVDKSALISDCLAGLTVDPLRGRTADLRTGLSKAVSARLRAAPPNQYAREVRGLDTILSGRRPEAIVELVAHAPVLARRLAAAIAEDRASILAHWDRFRPACSLLALIDARGALRAFRDHCAAWGRLHRLIAPICVEGQAVAALSCFQLEHDASEMIHQPEPPVEAFWEAWRLASPVRAYPPSESSALRLALALAEIAVLTASDPSTEWSPERSWIERHFYGWDLRIHDAADPSPRHSQATSQGTTAHSPEPQAPRYRKSMIEMQLIEAAMVVERRDRLLRKMSGHAATVTALTSLRIENLRSVPGHLYEHGSDGAFHFKADDQDEEDFLGLVCRIKGTSGWLFASVEAPYGSLPLTNQEVGEILAGHVKHFSRRAERTQVDRPATDLRLATLRVGLPGRGS